MPKDDDVAGERCRETENMRTNWPPVTNH